MGFMGPGGRNDFRSRRAAENAKVRIWDDGRAPFVLFVFFVVKMPHAAVGTEDRHDAP